MANTVLQTQKNSQLQQNEQQHTQTESSKLQKIKVKLTRFVSYFSGNMAPFDTWMKGRLKQVIPTFTQDKRFVLWFLSMMISYVLFCLLVLIDVMIQKNKSLVRE